MKTITHHELCHFIKNRIKMILARNIEIYNIRIGVNTSNTSFIVKLNYNFDNDEKIFSKQYKLDKSDLDKTIYKFINEFDRMMN